MSQLFYESYIKNSLFGFKIEDTCKYVNPGQLTIFYSMKQEEDMMRYLYEYAADNEFLTEHQDQILLSLFEEVPAECLVTNKLECAPVSLITVIVEAYI